MMTMVIKINVMKNIITTLLILFNLSVFSQSFIGRKLSDVKLTYNTTDSYDQSVFYFNGTKVVLQLEQDIIVAEAYDINSESDYHKTLNLLNRSYEKTSYLDHQEFGEAFIHNEYKILCYKKDFTFIFLIYD